MNQRRPTLEELPAPPAGRSGWPWTEAPLLDRTVVSAESLSPRVSVVTPSYNQAQFIEETIRSVLLQDYPALEYMVVDGGSTDGTSSILKKYEGRVSKIVSEPDEGIYDAMNKGINLSTGDVIGVLNSDDFYTSNDVIENVLQIGT